MEKNDAAQAVMLQHRARQNVARKVTEAETADPPLSGDEKSSESSGVRGGNVFRGVNIEVDQDHLHFFPVSIRSNKVHPSEDREKKMQSSLSE